MLLRRLITATTARSMKRGDRMKKDFRHAKIFAGITVIAVCLAFAIGTLGGCRTYHPTGSGTVITKIQEDGTDNYPTVYMIWVQEYEKNGYGDDVIKSYEVTEETFKQYKVGDEYKPEVNV